MADDSSEGPRLIDLSTGEEVKRVPPKPTSIMPSKVDDDDDDIDDEDLDETLAERLWGLTEMFPAPVRSLTGTVTDLSWRGTKWLYHSSRVVSWVLASSATIMAFPVLFEMERAQMEADMLQQQRQIMLGPNAAVSGHPGAMPGPPMPRS